MANLAIQWLGAHIQESIANTNVTYIKDRLTPWNMTVTLWNTSALSNKFLFWDIMVPYQKFQKALKLRKLDMWLILWEQTHAYAKSISLPNVAGDWAVTDIQLAIKDINASFYSSWAGKVEHTGSAPTLPELVIKLWQCLTNETAMLPAMLRAYQLPLEVYLWEHQVTSTHSRSQ
jgi:hypothetical protein